VSTIDIPEALRLRLAGQRLHRPALRGSGSARVANLVGDLFAVQAQDIGAAPLALRARSSALTASAVAAARADRSIVRAWGPRGTLHLMATDDVALLVGLTGPIWRTGSLRRAAQEGVTGTPAELLRTVDRALSGAGPLSKVELGEALPPRLGARGQGLVHLALLAASHGKLVLGPDRANKPTYVHAADWLGAELDPIADRGPALAELARRYLRSHAPAGPADLAAWSGLPLGDARAGFAGLASDELVELTFRGRPSWRLRRGGARPVDVPLALLPAFDEWLLGWGDRSTVLEPAHTATVVHGGIIAPVLLAHGQVIGAARAGEVTPFGPLTAAQEKLLAAEHRDIARFRST
jgi:Winged helix DNA-binding domain